MKVCHAITGVFAAGPAAEGDGLAFLIAAIRVAAIAGFEFEQGQMTRIGLDAAKLDGLFALENRHYPSGQRCIALPQLVRFGLFGFRRLPWPFAGTIPTGESHSSGAADRGIAGI